VKNKTSGHTFPSLNRNVRRRRVVPQKKRSLAIEQLESRRLLATITVTSLADTMVNDSRITLREAIDAANSNRSIDGSPAGQAAPVIDRIVFASGLTGTISLSEHFILNESVTIEGPGADRLTIAGLPTNSGIPIFTVTSGEVRFKGLTLSGGKTTSLPGAAISSFGASVTIENSRLINNETEFAEGGAIAGSDIQIINSTVSGNRAFANGGAIHSTDSLTIVNSTIVDNSAANGGAINVPSGLATIVASTLSGNTAQLSGGAVYVSGQSTVASFINSTISGNSALAGFGGGGGIYVDSGSLEVLSSTVTANTTNASGGGIHMLDRMEADNSIIAGNTSTSFGIDMFEGPAAQVAYRSNVIGVVEGTSISRTVIMPIEIQNRFGTAASPLDPRLGPLANNGGPTKTHALKINSPAIDGHGAVHLPDDPYDLDGDGNRTEILPVDQRGTGFNRIRFDGLDKGAVEFQPLATLPFPLVVTTADDELDADPLADKNDLSLREAVLLANLATGLQSITFDPVKFANPTTITLTMGVLHIKESTAVNGPGKEKLTIDVAGDPIGSHFFVSEGDLTLRGLTMTGANSTGLSGTVTSASSGKLTIENSTISGNTTGGAAVYSSKGPVQITGSVLTDNAGFKSAAVYSLAGNVTVTNSRVSGNRGIAIKTDSASVTINNSEISQNTNYFYGGGIASQSGAITISSSTISGNAGNGISSITGGPVLVDKSTISNNTAATSGGGIHAPGSAVRISNSTIANNLTTGENSYGGGIFAGGPSLEITNSTISGNTTDGTGSYSFGGGIFSWHETFISHSTITKNQADVSGGGIFVGANGALTMKNSIVAENIDDSTAPDLLLRASTFAIAHSLIGDNAGNSLPPSATPHAVTGNIVGNPSGSVTVSPFLGPLANNGGTTQTHALGFFSPAIDAGDPAAVAGQNNVPALDQRNSPRVVNRIDMGAYEFGPNPLDFGDAPTPYPVTLNQNGARHTVGPLFLGRTIDAETNGTNSVNANADGSDEDGVVFHSSFISSNVPTKVGLTITASAPGFVDAWIDFNRDGDWLDQNDQIIMTQRVVAGANRFSVNVPANASVGNTAARFRISSGGQLAPTGPAQNGEVEDYLVAIARGTTSLKLQVNMPTDVSSAVIEGDEVVVRNGAHVLSQVPLNSFGDIEFVGTESDDVLQLTMLEGVAAHAIAFDGGLGIDELDLVEAGKTLDLTIPTVTLKDVEKLNIVGTGNNQLVLSVDAVKATSSTTDTLQVKSNHGDTINFGEGWRVERPAFIDTAFTHVIVEAISGGTARLELQNDRAMLNPLNRYDADRDGRIAPLDVLRIINVISRQGVGPVVVPTNDDEIGGLYFDVSGDNFLSPLDALRVINAISRINRGLEPEGEESLRLADPDQFPRLERERVDASDLALRDLTYASQSEDAKPHTGLFESISPYVPSNIDDVMSMYATDEDQLADDDQLALLSATESLHNRI
jgi:CSLREA domain-containing protein